MPYTITHQLVNNIDEVSVSRRNCVKATWTITRWQACSAGCWDA